MAEFRFTINLYDKLKLNELRSKAQKPNGSKEK